MSELDQTLAALPEVDHALTTPEALVTIARVARLGGRGRSG